MQTERDNNLDAEIAKDREVRREYLLVGLSGRQMQDRSVGDYLLQINDL